MELTNLSSELALAKKAAEASGKLLQKQKKQFNEILSSNSKDIKLKADGDIHVDLHHTVEDVGYALSQSILKALDKKLGIKRYGFYYIPMDECLSRCVLDFSGRPELIWKVNLDLEKVGEMDTELFHEFFKAFSNEAKCNLHVENLYGKNNHHIIESCFKAFAKSLRFAVEIDNRRKDNIPSSKGTL